jgi:hypothetical protein
MNWQDYFRGRLQHLRSMFHPHQMKEQNPAFEIGNILSNFYYNIIYIAILVIITANQGKPDKKITRIDARSSIVILLYWEYCRHGILRC